MSSLRARVNRILTLLDTNSDITYVFIKDSNEQAYKLMHNNDTLIDDNNYTFKTRQEVEQFTKSQAIALGVKKITPIIIDVIDNSYLEGVMYACND